MLVSTIHAPRVSNPCSAFGRRTAVSRPSEFGRRASAPPPLPSSRDTDGALAPGRSQPERLPPGEAKEAKCLDHWGSTGGPGHLATRKVRSGSAKAGLFCHQINGKPTQQCLVVPIRTACMFHPTLQRKIATENPSPNAWIPCLLGIWRRRTVKGGQRPALDLNSSSGESAYCAKRLCSCFPEKRSIHAC